MSLTLHLVVAVLVIVAATGVSRRIGVAAPLLLVAIGAGISYLPGAPVIHLQSELVLLIVLPPLLYAASVRFPIIDFRRNLAPIAALGVVLVIVNACVVGLLLWWLLPDLDLASAIALGAIVSPTDAVSATSIAKRIGLPTRIVTILEGESLINDAAALVLLRTAIAAIAVGFDLATAVGGFFWATLAGIAVGAVVGMLAVLVRRRFRDPILTTSISFVVPFIAYLPAEEINASGVIAVVTAGLIVGHHSVRTQTAQLRLAEQTNWGTVQFLLENIVFLLMGYQLKDYIADVAKDHGSAMIAIVFGLGTVLVLLVSRLGFTLPLFAVLNVLSSRIAAGRLGPFGRLRLRLIDRVSAAGRRRGDTGWRRRVEQREAADREFHGREQLNWRGSAVIGWAGMRGVVTVAAAQTLPEGTPYRSTLILMAFTVAVATLLLGGLTLPGVARLLGVRGKPRVLGDEVRGLFGDLAGAANLVLEDPELVREDGTAFPQAIVDRVAGEVRDQGRLAIRTMPSTPSGERQAELLELRRLVFRSEREALADARAMSAYGSEALDIAESILNTIEERAE